MGNIKDPNNPEDVDSLSDTDSEVENPGDPPVKPLSGGQASTDTHAGSAGPSAPPAPLSYGDKPEARGSVITPWGFPWDNFPFKYNGGLSSRGLVVARNVRLGFGRIHRVIAESLTVSCGSVNQAIVFGKCNIGMGMVKHLYCLPSTSINNGLSTVHHTTHLSEHQLLQMALEYARLPPSTPTPAQASTSAITTTAPVELPWGVAQNKVNLTMGHADCVMAHTVNVGMAGVGLCIGRNVKLGLGSIRMAVVFDQISVGAGSVRELFCLSSTVIGGGLHRIRTIHYLSVDELTEFAKRQGGVGLRT